ncbi:MAG: HupE/UreJ family protein [Alphaproteobacteria bacterium]
MFKSLAFAAAGMVVSGAAAAHTGGEHVHSFVDGFAHPFTGLDHLLVMVAVGIYAARAMTMPLALPAVFVGFMAGGAVLGMAGVPIAFAEAGILASVAVMAVLAAAGRLVPPLYVVPVVAAFAVLHGFAHGAEMAQGADPRAYGAGFVLATALLHGVGIALGLLVRRRQRPAPAP